MNKKKLGVSVGVVSLLALTAVGVGNKDALTKVLNNTPDNYVESISTYNDEEVKKITENVEKDDIKESEKLQNVEFDKSQIKELARKVVTLADSKNNAVTYAAVTPKQATPKANVATIESTVEEPEVTEPATEAPVEQTVTVLSDEEEPTTEEPVATTTSITGWTSYNLNLREEESNSSDILATIPKGTKVSGEESDGWVKVSYKNKEGFVAKSFISSTEVKVEEEKPAVAETKPIETKPTETNPVETKPTEVKPTENKPAETKPTETKPVETNVSGWVKDNLNLRKSASTGSSILATIPKGTKVSGTESNGWVKVTYNGKTGYVSKSYISSTEIKVEESKPAETKPTETKPVENKVSGWVKSNLNLRKSASTSSSILATIPKGTKISGTESNGWVKVTYNGKNGYVSKSYISSTEVKPDSNSGSSNQGSTSNSSTIDKIVNDAHKYLGYRYVYGAASPSTGFDCSGLTYYLYKTHAGITLNRNSAAQASNGYQVSKSNLKPGDLVFFATSGGTKISHVGIYIGNGDMIHASTPTKGVIKSSINSSYYTSRFVTARRIIN